MSTPILFLVTVLVNAFWQPLLIVGITWLGLRLSRCSNATTRHFVWTLAFVASVLVPLLSAMPIATQQVASASSPVRAVTQTRPAQLQAIGITAHAEQAVSHPTAELRRPTFAVQPSIATAASVVWFVVALGILARLLLSFFYLERLKRDALPLAVDSRRALTRYDRAEKGYGDVRICVSNEINVPVAVGIFDAMILLPAELLRELEANDLDRILLHELAHVRRLDDWVNLFERIAQAVLFFSPGIHWIAHEMDLEREVACDDWVLEQSTDNVPYARCLAHIVEVTQWPYAAPAAPGVFVTRKSMSIRIERLLARGRDVRLRLAATPTVLSLTLMGAIVVAGGFVSPLLAYTIDRTAATPTVHAIAHGTGAIAGVPPAHDAAVPTAKANASVEAILTPKVKANVTTQANVKMVASRNHERSTSSTDSKSGSGPKQLVANESYLDELAALGYKNLTIDEVIELKSLGVDREYIESLQRAGYRNLTARELAALKSVEVTGEYIVAMRNAGLTELDTRMLIELKSLGVDGEYIRSLAAAGYPNLSARDYVQLKALGIDAAYVRSLASHGFTHLAVKQLVEYKSLGVFPR